MRGCPPSARPTAAPSARSWRCCANTSPPPVTSWSASTSTTGIPGPDWTGPAWTRCVMPPRPGSSNGCGACRRTGSPAPTPTRCWCSTSWTASASPWRFTDSPGLAADDPQATLLTQVQGVIAEYEKAKIAERYRRGKLFRARAGEIVTWKASYGYRRIPRSAATGQAHHEVYEPEAAVVRRIFTDRAAGITVREICRRLNADAIPSPTGKPTWGHSTLCRLLRNEAYIGRVYYNRTESVPDRRPTRRNRQVPRDRDEWIPIDCPRIVSDELFQAAGRVATDNTKWSPRRAEPGAVAAQRTCQMRCLRRRHQLPQDARPQRHLAPLLLLPQPRPHPRRRRIPPLPRTQHPRRRPRRVRVRPHPRRDHPPRPAAGRRTSRHPDNPDPRRRTPLRRTGPAGPQDRRRRHRTAPPHRPLPGVARRCSCTWPRRSR